MSAFDWRRFARDTIANWRVRLRVLAQCDQALIAEIDPWRVQIELRILRYLLRRYAAKQEDFRAWPGALPESPIAVWRFDPIAGCKPRSREEIREVLLRIAQTNLR